MVLYMEEFIANFEKGKMGNVGQDWQRDLLNTAKPPRSSLGIKTKIVAWTWFEQYLRSTCVSLLLFTKS